MLRKTVLATAIVGAGLGSMSGAAFAGDAPSNGGHHGGGDGGGKHHSAPAAGGCSNTVGAKSENGSGRSLGDTTGGSQDVSASNLCNILSGNEVLSNNNVSLLGDITNGDTRNETVVSTVTDTLTSTTDLG